MRTGVAVMMLMGCGVHAACAQQSGEVNAAGLPDWSGAWSSEDTPQVGNPGSANAAPLAPAYAAGRAMLAPGAGAAAHCLEAGMPAIMDHGVTFEFVFSPGRVTLIFQNGSVRRIYTDGRGHPDASGLYFNVEGHSIGHWQGSTLVIDTVGMDPRAELFRSSTLTVTKHTHILERISRKDAMTLQIDTVVSDPSLFTKPYEYTWAYGSVGSMDDFPTGCAQNNRDTGKDVDLTPPPGASP